ncbi:MAG: hypothetical protein KGJ78_04365 [Alphaproteobacteria bacterium]|nr:hypothetical protein [Alphaproteobacteria bacterium]
MRLMRHCPGILAAFALVACLAGAASADSVATTTADGYARLFFRLDPAAQVTAQVTGGVLVIKFDRKVAISPATIATALPSYISQGRADPNGKALRFVLVQPVRLHTSTSQGRAAVDLLPARFSGTPPDLPPPPPPAPTTVDPSTLATLNVRAGAYQNYTRIVFDWPKTVPYAVFPGDRRLTVRFEALARPDFSAMTRLAPPWVKAAGWHVENRGIVVEFTTDAASGFHDFRDGTHIVIDILAPKTDADAYKPAGIAKPLATALAKHPGMSTAQAQAIAETADKLNGTKPTDIKQQAPVGQPAAPADAPADASKTPNATPALQAADTRFTRSGVVLTFPGAGRRGSAVFIRGLTAWIVLEGAAPLDAEKLKSQLADFSTDVEAASSSTVSVLRLSLKTPEQIAATAEGSLLKVTITPDAASSAIAVGFARNQDNPTHSSLSTLLPGATQPLTLVDPVAGDELIVVPGEAGRAMTTERRYVEFTALGTASGLVFLPLVDDLSVTVNTTRVIITRPGGLSLTPPTMPAAATPEALAEKGQGPCFLDFEQWKKVTGGTFLATERRLRASIARLKPEQASHARLVLARFYIANGFAAEALGLVNLMQTLDPSLSSDMQLQAIKAAADYEMGRYREANNALAGAQFDSDRHAALWRGLIEAALEQWTPAHADLERAMPVLDSYSKAMHAKVRLANAEAALGIGRLEIADAQLSRIPEGLERPLMLEAALDRARLYAAENRQRPADKLFAAVESSGDERLATKAIYYRITAAFAAGRMPAAAAINGLERLRFRWRGDVLELNTLRKLASLYFGQKNWRDGLRTLRIASANFPNDDMAGKAQDDMRNAFVELFLKGKADSMPPIESLALFYDFIDLTPIGPDGDEMIRRMADRLVAVDLLGPAADLLNYQVTKRLDGIARAQVATRLAMIQIMDHKPQDAIATLRSTQIAGLPDDVNHQRILLEARAMAQEKLWDQALDLISVDQAPDTEQLRADIYWESGNWAVSAQKAEAALGPRWSDATPLTPAERQQVMRMAVAYSMANDETSLERIRDHFGPKMNASPDASAFLVITQRIDLHGVAFRDAAAQVASVDSLTAFMKDLQKRPL